MLVFDFLGQQEAFINDMSRWIKSGEIVWEETITNGLENAPAAFIGYSKATTWASHSCDLAEISVSWGPPCSFP